MHGLLLSWERAELEKAIESGKTGNDGDIRGEEVKYNVQGRVGTERTQRDLSCLEEVRGKCQATKELTLQCSQVSNERVLKKRSCHTPVEQVVSGILACSAMKKSYRDILTGVEDVSNVEGLGVDCIFVVLCGSEELIRRRLERRQGHYMPASLLCSQLDTLEVPTADEGRRFVLIQDLTLSVDAIVTFVLQQLSLFGVLL